MVTSGWMLTGTPLPIDLEKSGGLDRPLDHCGGQLDSILGHQVAPQNYGGLTIALDHVLVGQYWYYHVQG